MQETAKALVLQKANKLKLQHATYEASSPEAVVVKTIATTITPGLDRLLLTNKPVSSRVLNYPIMPGSEAIGQVVSKGSAVTDLEPGDFVYAFKGDCWTGVEPYYGCHAEIIPTSRKNLLPLRRQSTHRDLLIGLAGYAISGIDKTSLNSSSRVLVLGLGSVGLMVTEYLRRLGVTRIDAVETFGIRGQLSHAENIALDIEDFDEGFNSSYDLIVETTGRILLLEKAARLMKQGAGILLMGSYEVLAYDYRLLQHKEPVIICSSVTSHAHLEKAAKELEEERIESEKFFTDIFPVAEYERAYRKALDSKESIKTVMIWL
ncbi:zinc-binding alcohol dehydrogenase [Chlorobium phaeovibrioides]|uniref:Alcohol dehydrogenase n=2 Tax=Chlorobium phaeovibrioides TaxID=1094 RepID=A0A432AX17_CHLPH|nr:zinc-binding alcohol dehydrogenase [Chlorobium phaeovibrioides]HCD36428.1 alcohol dehydrogenase [Chlorobium sp.]KAA6232662.1 zinc-binding alcohol dehydrogenase [Chlorobium phaeovibrioides]MWV53735.1 alcohol dehydrogenase [Chlorobium phaeovibrioides]QEQ56946.1 zinc-binding alcohol dehydrogenase [Chlorobium phaeovibrioides]RTY37407.1 zinc-binding alcohol dehydrogenase [Chlorobium phaeovibrioides]